MHKTLKQELSNIDDLIYIIGGRDEWLVSELMEFFGWEDEKMNMYLHYLFEKKLIEYYAEGDKYIVSATSAGIAFFLDDRSFLRDRKRDEIRYAKEWFDTYIYRWTASILFVITFIGFIITLIDKDRPPQKTECCCNGRDSYKYNTGKFVPKDAISSDIISNASNQDTIRTGTK